MTPKRLFIHVPAARGFVRGNWVTALRWERVIRQLGHQVTTVACEEFHANLLDQCDGVIALHAQKSAAVIEVTKRRHPGLPLVVTITGTDLHVDLPAGGDAGQRVLQSLDHADRIVLLEPMGAALIPQPMHHKLAVIFQSAEPVEVPQPSPPDTFRVSLVGHLRTEKDPLLIGEATRLLPASSKIEVFHLGAALTTAWERQAQAENASNPRYNWLGGVSHTHALTCMAGSDLNVLTSRVEGAPTVISEAVVNEIPVLATRICATQGMLGTSYPGLFPVGDARELSRLLSQAEINPNYYQSLKQAVIKLKPKFSLDREVQSWASLLRELFPAEEGHK